MLTKRLFSLTASNKQGTYEYSNFGYASLVEVFVHDDLSLHNTHISSMSGDLGMYWEWRADDTYLSAGDLVSDIEDLLA